MEIFNSYTVLIAASLIIILSYGFNLIAKKVNIPSVLLLILTGILIKLGLDYLGVGEINLFPILEILGIVGLIMIVLEAALELELTREKIPLIVKSITVALIALLGTTSVITYIIHHYLIDDLFTAALYAIPLSVISSAIVIPSVGGLIPSKKEFLIYEATFSDILGIMLFYFMIENAGITDAKTIAWNVTSNILLTVSLSFVLSFVLIIIFKRLESNIKLFLLIAVLLLLYSVGKLLFHLSSLIIILVFGLMVNNSKLFFRGFMKRFLDTELMAKIYHNFHVITLETAFVVRTFFFVIFGMYISLASLVDINVAIISALILIGLYLIRYITLKIFLRNGINPELFIAPRGLITILLFFAIPVQYQVSNFDNGILLYPILVSSLLMTFALINDPAKKKAVTPEGTDWVANGEAEEVVKENSADAGEEGAENGLEEG